MNSDRNAYPVHEIKRTSDSTFLLNGNKENINSMNQFFNNTAELSQEVIVLKARVATLERKCEELFNLLREAPPRQASVIIPPPILPARAVEPPLENRRENPEPSLSENSEESSGPEIDPDSLKEALTNYMEEHDMLALIAKKEDKNETRKICKGTYLEISNTLELRAEWKKEEEYKNEIGAQRGFIHVDGLLQPFSGFLIKLPAPSKEYIFVEPCCVRKAIISFKNEEVSHSLLMKIFMNPETKAETVFDYLAKQNRYLFFCLYNNECIRLAKVIPGPEQTAEKYEAVYGIQDEYLAIMKRPPEIPPKSLITKEIIEQLNEGSQIMVCEVGKTNSKVLHHALMGLDMVFIIQEITAEVKGLIKRLTDIKDELELEEVTLELLKCDQLQPGVAIQDLAAGGWEWRDAKLLKEIPPI